MYAQYEQLIGECCMLNANVPQPELDSGGPIQYELDLDEGGPDTVQRLVEDRPSRYPPYRPDPPQ